MMADRKRTPQYSDAEISAARQLHREGFSPKEIGRKLNRAYPVNLLSMAGVKFKDEQQARKAKMHDNILRMHRQGYTRGEIAEKHRTSTSYVAMVLRSTVPLPGQKVPLLSAAEIAALLTKRKWY